MSTYENSWKHAPQVASHWFSYLSRPISPPLYIACRSPCNACAPSVWMVRFVQLKFRQRLLQHGQGFVVATHVFLANRQVPHVFLRESWGNPAIPWPPNKKLKKQGKVVEKPGDGPMVLHLFWNLWAIYRMQALAPCFCHLLCNATSRNV